MVEGTEVAVEGGEDGHTADYYADELLASAGGEGDS